MAVLALAGAGASASAQPAAAEPLPDFDRRERLGLRAPVPERVDEARERYARRLGRRALVDVNTQTGGARRIARLDGVLAPRRSGRAERIARDWIASHRDELGLTEADLRGLRLADRLTTPGGVTRLVWEQTADGIAAYGAGLQVHVTRDGAVLSFNGSPVRDLRAPAAAPVLSARDAARLAATNVSAPAPGAPTARTPGPSLATRLKGGARARLTLFPQPGDTRLAWRVQVTADDGLYDAVVDAADGRILARRSLTSAATALTFDDYPGAPVGGLAQPSDITAYLTAADRLQGPRVHAYADIDGDDIADAGEEVPPSAPGGDWDYARLTVASPFGLCPTAGCSWNHQTPESWRGAGDGGLRQATTQAFSVTSRYLERLAAPPFGLDDASGGFSAAGNDAMLVEALDSAAVDAGLPRDINNANMSLPPDGQAPRLQAYLFRPVPGSAYADVHGGDDAGVMYHEVVHAYTGRRVIDASGASALGRQQSGALSEGWSDFLAIDRLVEQGLRSDGPGAGELVLDAFVGGGREGLRTQGVDCPVGVASTRCPGAPGAGPGGYTYGDYGRIAAEPEIHADGELWAQTLWDLRTRVGAATARSLVAEALALTPNQPSLLDARDAIIGADIALGGSNRQAIWEAFAARGMGYFASAIDANDDEPVEDFTVPPAPGGATGTLGGTIVDPTSGEPVAGATVRLGGHSNDVGHNLPFALTTTTTGTGAFQFTGLVPGTYPHLIVTEPSHERLITRGVAVAAGSNTRNLRLRRNWLAEAGGAVVLSGSQYTDCPGSSALDGDFNSGWCHDVGDERSLEINLPQNVFATSIGIDPRARSGLDEASSVAQYRIETRDSGTFSDWVTVSEGTFTRADNARLSTFAIPGAPLRTRRVRVTMMTPQRPGRGTASQYMGLAEVQLFATTNQRPVGLLSYLPEAPRTGDEVTFFATGSGDPDGQIVAHDWDLDGNGSFETHTGEVPEARRTYTTPAQLSVRLRLTDDANETRVVTQPLIIDSNARLSGLGTLGGDNSVAGEINSAGQVAGQSQFAPGNPAERAFRFDGGTMDDLGALGTGSIAFTLNSAGVAVGHSTVGGQRQATMFPPGSGPVAVGSLDPGGESVAGGITDSGVVVGWSKPASSAAERRAFIKPPGGEMTELGTLDAVPDPDDWSDAWDINSSGTVVGWAEGAHTDPRMHHAAISTAGGRFQDLGTIGGRWSVASTINDRGQMAGLGEAMLLGEFHAWVSTGSGALKDIGTLGGTDSEARDIDVHGDVVGWARVPNGTPHAFLYRDGGMIDLNTLLPAGSGWELLVANGINEAHQISGYGLYEGKEQAFVLDIGECVVCVEDVDVEHRDLPSGAWTDVPAGGTYDGNRLRVRARLKNNGTTTQVFNVKFRDSLTGAELEDSRLAESLAPGASRTVEYEWDTDGLAWSAGGQPASDRGVRVSLTVGRSAFDERSHPVKIKPRPAFLAHGLWSDASTWDSYPGFAAAAHPDWEMVPVTGMDTGVLLSAGHAPNQIYDNAAVLDAAITAYREQHDAAHVDVVAHSMGGLITRQYIHSFMPAPAAGARPIMRHLVQLGTPNRGSPCADVLLRADSWELRTEQAARFNSIVTNRKGVRFSVIAGNPQSFTCIALNTPGDSVVGVPSAEWEIADKELRPILHTDMNASQALFDSFVRPRLDRTTDVQVAPAASLRSARLAPDASAQAIAGELTTIDPRGTLELDGAIAGEPSVGYVVAGPPTVTTELVDPAGDAHAAVAADSDGARQPIRAGHVAAPAAGQWRLRVVNTSFSPAYVSASLVTADSPVTLTADTGALDARRRLRVTATLRNDGAAVPGATVTATARATDGSGHVVRLTDDGASGDGAAGDGVYGGLTGALAAGRWLLAVDAVTATHRRLATTVADVPAATPSPPAPSTAAGRIAFVRTSPTRSTILSVAADGTGLGAITEGEVTDLSPAWSPDGTRIAFARRAAGTAGFDIFVAGADGSEVTRLTDDAGWDESPDWSPDGTRIVFSRRPAPTGTCPAPACATADLWTMNADGTQQTRLTSGESTWDESRPSWSPDGTRIAFERSVMGGRAAVFVVPSAGGAQSLLHSALLASTRPRWSPDGREISFSHALALNVLDVAGGGVAPLGALVAASGAWAPAGDRIAFAAAGRIQTATAYGAGASQVSSGSGVHSDPDWGPSATAPPQRLSQCRDVRAATPRRSSRVATIQLSCSEPIGAPVTLTVTSQPGHGTLSPPSPSGPGDGEAQIAYTPDEGYIGADEFTYVAVGPGGTSAPATVTIDVREAGEWSQVTDIASGPSPEYSSAEVSAAMLPDGSVVALWGHHQGNDAYELAWSRMAPDGTWEAPRTLDPNGDARSPRVAIGPGGQATAVWSRGDGSGGGSLLSATLAAGADSWSAAQALFQGTGMQHAGIAELAVGSSGAAVVAYELNAAVNGFSRRIAAHYRPSPDAAWGPQQFVSEEGASALWPAATIDAAGRATVAAIEYVSRPGTSCAEDRSRIVTRRAGGGGWEGREVVEERVSTWFFLPQLVAEPSGGTRVTAYANGACGGNYVPDVALAYTRPAGGPWGAFQQLSGVGASDPTPTLAGNGAGGATVAWSDSVTSLVRVADAPAGEPFGAPSELPLGPFLVYPFGYRPLGLQFDPAGTATLTFAAGTPSLLQASRRGAGGTFGPAQEVSLPGSEVTKAAVTSEVGGRAVAVWLSRTGPRGELGGVDFLRSAFIGPRSQPGPAQRAPVCQNGAARTPQDAAVDVGFVCADADGDPLQMSIVGGPAHGTLGALDQERRVARYTPAPGFHGTDSFTYRASDGGRESAVATITLTVDAPPPPQPQPSGGGGSGGGGTGSGPSVGMGSSSPGSNSGSGSGSGSGSDDRACTVGTAGCQVPVTCPASAQGGCSGDVANQAGGGAFRAVAAAIKRKPKTLFKKAKFRIPAGKSKRIKLQLTVEGKRQLARKRRFTTGYVVRYRDSAGRRGSYSGRVTFKAPKRKKARSRPKAKPRSTARR